MLREVDARDLDSWQRLGRAISAQLRRDIRDTPVGTVLKERLADQVTLIQSIPVQAAKRVHRLTLAALEDSRRAKAIAEEIKRSGPVAATRATLIARTEVARTASVLVQARSFQNGITHYVWRTAEDEDVRIGHKAMEGKVIAWAFPPAVNENGRIMHHHAGCIWNCRCWPEPLITLHSERLS